jgi:hypothetical protein
MENTKKIKWRNIIISIVLLVVVWISVFFLNLNSRTKADEIKSFVGDWKIYFTNQIPEKYILNGIELFFTVTEDEKEIDKYYHGDEVVPAGVHILRCGTKEKSQFEVCGFDGLETSSCIVIGNFDLDNDKEILLVYYRDISNKLDDFSVVDFTGNGITISAINENTSIGKYIKQYFKSTYFLGFSETTYSNIFFYIAIGISVIIFIYIIYLLIIAKKNNA